MTEIILRTNEGQPRPKYIYNKCGTNIDFFYSTKIWSITITKLYIFFSLINIIFFNNNMFFVFKTPNNL